MAFQGQMSFEDVTTTSAMIAKFDANSNSSSITSATTGVRTGSRSLGLVTNASVRKNITAASTLIVGFSFYITALPTSSFNIFAFTDASGNVQASISLNQNGAFIIAGASGSATSASGLVTVNTLHYFQFKVVFSTSAASFTAILNAVTTLTTTGTTPGNNASAFMFYSPGSKQVYIDDLLWVDGTGTANNDLFGQPKIECLRPTGAGSNTGLSNTGGTANWNSVADANPDDDSTYVSSATAGTNDTYQTSDLVATSGYVMAIQTTIRARKDDASTRQIAAELHIAGANYDGATQTLTAAYANYSEVREINPATGVQFTLADVNAMEVGVKVVV